MKTLSAKYFSEHDFHDIPIKFIHRIGELEACNLITGFVAIIEYIKRIYPNSKEYIYSILSQVPELIHTAIGLVKDRKINSKHILPIDVLIQKRREEFLQKDAYKEIIQKRKF